jgi:predicted HTH transcriptional regulator
VRRRAQEAAGSGARDLSIVLRKLDPRQRKALKLFRDSDFITSRHLETLFGISQRTARGLLTSWVADGFVTVADPAKKTRKYGLGSSFAGLRH